MTWVKVCGLGRGEEVACAVEAGADAVGFVSVPGSPRYVELDRARDLADGVPAMRVLLTADLTPMGLLAALEQTGLDAAQPYGVGAAEAAAAAVAEGYTVLYPVRVDERGPTTEPVPGTVPLYDTHRSGFYGGTGESFDWELLSARREDFIVAGGLGPDNVADVIRLLGPWGVDASSLLEADPGVKDLGKVTAFVGEAKRA